VAIVTKRRPSSAQGAQRVRNADARSHGETASDASRHGDRQYRKDQRTADDLKQWTDRAEEVAGGD